MALDILIVDDDELARERLRQLLARCAAGLCGKVEEAADATRAAGLMRHRRYDLLLLDVRLPGDSGMHLANYMRDLPQRPAVVFVTGYAEHALAAFDADAIDYLTKPVRPERLQRALAKAIGQCGPGPAPREDDSNSLRISHRGQAQRLPLAEVLYVQAELKRLTVATAHGEFTMDGTLAELEDRFPTQLLRVHRHTLVAVQAIQQLKRVEDEEGGNPGWVLSLRGTRERLAVARRMVAGVRERLLCRGS